LPAGLEATHAALAVRRAVANLGSVDPGFIRAEDVYPDQLGVLPFWDSIDWLAFLFELEEQLGTKISTKEMEMSSIIPDRVAVREWAAGVYRMLAARGPAETRPARPAGVPAGGAHPHPPARPPGRPGPARPPPSPGPRAR